MTKLICLMPTYNKETTLTKAIESVMMQKTSFDYKLIILDDCSSDNSNKIAEEYKGKYPQKIDIVRNSTNLKLLRTIIKGYSLLKDADYFCVLDADDWYTYDKKFAEAVDFLDKHKKYSMYMTNIILKKGENEEKFYNGNKQTMSFDFNDRKHGKATFIQTSGVIYRNIYFKTGHNKDFEKILTLKFPESYRADGFRFEWYLQGGRAYFENKLTAVYNYDMNGIWSSMSDAEQTLHNSKMMYSCAEFIRKHRDYYMNNAKNMYIASLVKFQNISEEVFAKNKQLICDLSNLLIYTPNKWYENIFSVKKISKTRKIITILGIKIKLKRSSAKKYVINWNDRSKYIENLKNSFKAILGYECNLKNPKTLAEKMMWLRAYDNTSLKSQCADKYEVRSYVKEKISEEYLVPLLGVYDDFDNINFDDLPDKFVIKCNHGSGYNIIVNDKASFDQNAARKKINKWLREDYGSIYGEIHYSDIKPRIIIEKYIGDINGNINDYKIWCFNGKAQFLYVAINSTPDQIDAISLYDLDFKKLPIKYGKYNSVEVNLSTPNKLKEMVNIAESLSKEFKFVRVDFYNIGEKLFFSEMTFTPSGGYLNFQPDEWNIKLGNLLNIE